MLLFLALLPFFKRVAISSLFNTVISAREMELIAIQVTFNDVYILRSQVNSLAGFVFGGDVLRLFHGDECLTIPPRETDNVHKYVFQVSALFI